MAKKVEKKSKIVPPAKAGGHDDLEVMHPERTITVRSRKLVVREYGFTEGLRLRAQTKTFFDALYSRFAESGYTPAYDYVEEIVAEHIECVLQLVAASANVEVEWLHTLDDKEGSALLTTWWVVNAGFFIRRVIARMDVERTMANLSVSPASTTPSSAPDMGTAPQTSAN